MDADYLRLVVQALQQRDVTIEPGLSDSELNPVEATYDFVFPPDLRAFLHHALPTSPRLPNWRRASKESLGSVLRWPLNRLADDLVDRDLWLPAWGAKPAEVGERLEIAHRAVERAPTLIPIYG